MNINNKHTTELKILQFGQKQATGIITNLVIHFITKAFKYVIINSILGNDVQFDIQVWYSIVLL